MKINTYHISNNDWNHQTFSVLIQQIKDSTRKIIKGIDTGVERNRFNNSSSILEALAVEKGALSKIEEKNLQKLLDTISKSNPALPSFIEHDKVKDSINLFPAEEKKQITDTKSAIVFIINEYGKGNVKVNSSDSQTIDRKESNIRELNNAVTVKDEQKRFNEQILFAIKTKTPIGWINVEHINVSAITGKTEAERSTQFEAQKLLRHEGIITCLREHIYASKQPSEVKEFDVEKTVEDKVANEKRQKSFGFKVLNFLSKQSPLMKKIKVKEPRTVMFDIIPQFVQFAFEDGSISAPFPLYSMVEAKPKAKLISLKVALISNRHFELDSIVDTCIIRNSEISRLEDATIADQEKLSFDLAEQFFQETIDNTGSVNIELYHTGLEPAVIGTYRAFINTLLKKGNRGKIMITPKVFKGGSTYDELKQWY